jgi:hypothetical protein
MAKKFLDVLGEAFEEDVLSDLIPSKNKAPAPQHTRRKKRFVEKINETIPHDKNALSKGKTPKKSLLDTMEEALDNQVFDQIFPKSKSRPSSGYKPSGKLESPFSTMITTEVLERARQIAISKGMRVKDVINMALKIYVEQEFPA